MNFNELKATAVAASFLEKAGGRLEDLKLMKLMYLAEREQLRRANCGISGDSFYSMQNGPVLSETLRLMQGRPRSSTGDLWNQHIHSPEQWVMELLKPLDPGVLSEAEENILDAEWKAHGRKNKWNLVDLTHTFPEWDERARTRKTSIPIPVIDIFEAMDLPPRVVESRLAEMRAADYFEDVLDQAATALQKGAR